MNMDNTADIIIKATRIGTGLYLTSLAIAMQSHLKKPTLAMPSTITIIPAMKIIVAQFMPLWLAASPV